MIKYLGSKRALVNVIGRMATATESSTAVDLFTGTTRVAQELKKRGLVVTAVDLATYSKVLADCFIATDADSVDSAALADTLRRLDSLPGNEGYVTETFCRRSRFFQPKNGARIDAIRDAIGADYRNSPLFPILLTSLMLAADRVDSTTGVQMAYLKTWAPRSYHDLELRSPDLLSGPGTSILDDACKVAETLPRTDFLYLDPPYNQHRYFTNYHIWETLIRWDEPEYYGVACKRIDSKDESTKSVFNRRQDMPDALWRVLRQTDAEVVVVSYNDESWITPDEMLEALHDAGHEDARMVAFDSKRYIGAQIGIHGPSGTKVGEVSHLRNTEYLFVAGPSDKVKAAVSVASSPRVVTAPH